MQPVLKVTNLHVYYETYSGMAKVLNGIDLEIQHGETLGLIGETGSGKSVLVSAIVGLLGGPGRIVEGEVLVNGQRLGELREEDLRRLRGTVISMIMQNARLALDPLAKVGNQIAAVYQVHTGATKEEAQLKAIEMIQKVQLPDPERVAGSRADELSGGMAQRISIAMALVCSPSLLIADSPTSGLDVTVQAQVLELLAGLASTAGLSTLITTSDLGIVAQYCDRVAVLYRGRIVEAADVKTFFRDARHPYSLSLIASASYRSVIQKSTDVHFLDAGDLPSGCHFHPRCPLARSLCREQDPKFEQIAPAQHVRCHYWAESRGLLDDDAA